MPEKENSKPNVRIILTNLEDYVERCKKRNIPTIFFTVREAPQREDKRVITTIELTAMDYTEAASLTFFKYVVSEPIASQEEYEAYKKEINLNLMGGEVEVLQNGKKEFMKVPGIVPYIQGEYAGAEIKAGWIGW
jgi:hypothetical protein